MGRRFSLDAAKHAVELRERLKAGGISRLTDARVGVKQHDLRGLDAFPGEIIGEGQTGCALENPAKITGAHIGGAGDVD